MLIVTGSGMVSPLGLDAASSCAAARAGIRRPTQIDQVQVISEDNDDVAPIVGYQVPIIAPGFFGMARLAQLGAGALHDLQRTLPDLEDRRLGVILLAGQQVYKAAWIRAARKAPEPEMDELEDDELRLVDAEQKVTAELLAAIWKRAGMRTAPAKALTLRGTCGGIVTALQTARQWLQSGDCHRCLLGVVDSLVDLVTLEALHGLELLRSVDRPVGMFPGEAATFHALELPGTVTTAPAPVHAVIEAPLSTSGRQNPRVSEDEPGDVEPFALTLSHVIQHLHGGKFDGVLVTNLNGDEHRADVWANTLLRLRHQHSHNLGVQPTWLPCASFGDPGAAIAGVSVAMMVQGWARGYATLPTALICLLDDFGGRTVIPVRRDN